MTIESVAERTVAPRERPILFSGPMVRAILAGRKSQTRRLWKDGQDLPPHGIGGERLWVRETWYCDHMFAGDFETTRRSYNNRVLSDEQCIAEWADPSMMYYRADGEAHDQFEALEGNGRIWRPSIFMPRWASRITLEIVHWRRQRLQMISPDDARAEGLPLSGEQPASINGKRGSVVIFDPVKAFAVLWDQINGQRASWASNPYVWAISFRRIEGVRS